MILYGASLSPFVRKCMFMLYELGQDFEQTMLPPGSDDADFRATSPLGRIPGFEDGDVRLWDSSAICHYLDRRHDSDLIGRDPQRVAQIVGLDKYADGDLSPAVFGVLMERVVKPIRFDQAPDEARVAALIDEKMPPVFDYLSACLGLRDWLVGNEFSYADIAVGAHMANLSLADVALDGARWPELDAWSRRLSARSAHARMLESARNFGK